MKDFLIRRVLNKNDVVFREGELGNTMYVIERGRVLIWRGTEDKPVEFGVLPKGAIFGEMAIFDGKPRIASAKALEETVLVTVNGTYVREALRRSDPIVTRLLQVVTDSARDLAEQYHRSHLVAEQLRERLERLNDEPPLPPRHTEGRQWGP